MHNKMLKDFSLILVWGMRFYNIGAYAEIKGIQDTNIGFQYVKCYLAHIDSDHVFCVI